MRLNRSIPFFLLLKVVNLPILLVSTCPRCLFVCRLTLNSVLIIYLYYYNVLLKYLIIF
ncbi:hypothetical protein DM02DRAFT_282213 [Periconia macrospinosa]|uniref:Uncharacterized protein n=1 Tax=Periconia macrospinosa TaxID=97972 RepID=A0A2V1D4A6_9PLEO|nr:hypothetical protein DM02DRAFT_282213 [Periconia macrospinosa]